MLGGVATSGETVLAARALQGIAAAIAVPAALSLLQLAAPDGPERDRSLGFWTATGAIGGASGFAIGGVLTEALGWRSLFWLGVPLIVMAIVTAPRVVPPVRAMRGPAGIPGVLPSLLIPAGLFLLINGITALQGASLSVSAWLQIGIGYVLLWMAFRTNASAARPLIPMVVFGNTHLLTATGVAASITFVTSGTGTLMSFWLQDEYGLRPLWAGLVLMLMSAGVVIGARTGSVIMHHTNRRRVMSTGLAGLATAGGAFVLGVEMNSLWVLGASLAFSGACLGWTSVGTTAFGLSTVTEDVRGIASGVLSAAAPVGTATGVAVMLTVAQLGQTATGSASLGAQIGLAASLIPLTAALLGLWRFPSQPSHT
jgi:MFS family permease